MTPTSPLNTYRDNIAAQAPPFFIPRRFVADDRWHQTAIRGNRHSSMLREYDPELPTILQHQYLLVLGEPGAGKSTVSKAITHHLAKAGPGTPIPIHATLRSYNGDLAALLRATIPPTIIDDAGIPKTYVLDGIDEVPTAQRTALRDELHTLAAAEPTARFILTARQAFHAHNPDAFPKHLTIFHLQDFDEYDIKTLATRRGIDPEAFLQTARDTDCSEELHNPFVLKSLLDRYEHQHKLSPLRTENIRYVVDELLRSRPHVTTHKQRRALQMLAITCETLARNELTTDEALQVLTTASVTTRQAAQELLDELSNSILTITSTGISFLLHSHGEYLAAEELHGNGIERLKELAFHNNHPIDSWRNTITYLAELDDKIRAYFLHHHPHWLTDVSPTAFTHEERTTLTEQLLTERNTRHEYLADERIFRTGRLARLLTATTIATLHHDLASTEPHRVANALLLLSIRQEQGTIDQALPLVTAHRNASTLRYSAILALINAQDPSPVPTLLEFLDPTDNYHLQLVDTIGGLCTPNDFPTVLPLLARTNAGLSATYAHFREFHTRASLTATIEFLTNNPSTLQHHDLDMYLEPVLYLINEHWSNDLADQLGHLLSRVDGMHVHHGKLADRLFEHLAKADHDRRAIKTCLTLLHASNTPLRTLQERIAPQLTPTLATWIATTTPTYARALSPWVAQGPTRDILDPVTPAEAQAMQARRAQYDAEQAAREIQTRTVQETRQASISTSTALREVLDAAIPLAQDHWPALPAARREWLAAALTQHLLDGDLAHLIQWHGDTLTTHRDLHTVLALTDFYHLTLTDDVPLILALRGWHEEALTNYFGTHELSGAAREALHHLLTDENEHILKNALTFLSTTGNHDAEFAARIKEVASDHTKPAHLRREAIDILAHEPRGTATLRALHTDDPEPSIRQHAFRLLVQGQDRPTISRALAALTADDPTLQAADAVPFHECTAIDWIGDLTADWSSPPLIGLRKQALAIAAWRATGIITSTLGNQDKPQAIRVIREQLGETPEQWRVFYTQQAQTLEREVRVGAAQQTPFSRVLQKLVGNTSMRYLKVYCEGKTDRSVLRHLLQAIGEIDIANTIGLIGGWPNLRAEDEPERWLDGCREAIIIMDGDQGRDLNHPERPLTEATKEIARRFESHPLTLFVLERYGIEHYFPQHAYEQVLGRDLSAYFPLPHHRKLEEHLCDRHADGTTTPLHRKANNQTIARHLSLADIAGTDLERILRAIGERAQQARME